MEHHNSYSKLIGGKSQSWIKLLVSMTRMADLSKWTMPPNSPATYPYISRSEQEEQSFLLYFEIAVAVIEFLAEADRKSRGIAVSLNECITDILFSQEICERFPDVGEEAVRRVIATLETPSILTFRLLDDVQFEQETAIIARVPSRDIERYYLTDSGRMLCALSLKIKGIENIDLDAEYLVRHLEDGKFDDYFESCESMISLLHKEAEMLSKISTTAAWQTQRIQIEEQQPKTFQRLGRAVKVVKECERLLESEKLLAQIETAATEMDGGEVLENRLFNALHHLLGAMEGVRSNLDDLLTQTADKYQSLVPPIDFFNEAVGCFLRGGLSDDYIDLHLTSFGLKSPRYSLTNEAIRRDRSPWAGTSAIHFLKQLNYRESQIAEEEDILPPPKRESAVVSRSVFDGMMNRHAKGILRLINKNGSTTLGSYLGQQNKLTCPDEDVPALFSLFVNTEPFNLYDTIVHPSIITPTVEVRWEKTNGAILHFHDIKLQKVGDSNG